MQESNTTVEQVLETRSPVEVEQALLAAETQAAIKQAKNINPADTAAYFFQMMYPQFSSCVGSLSNKDARRLAQALVQFPLVDENPKFNSADAQRAFSIGLRLIDAKLIMRETLHMEQRLEAGLNEETLHAGTQEILDNVTTTFEQVKQGE